MTGTIKAIIFDFDGTVANTMPFLTELAVNLITDNYAISRSEAQKKYLETTGMDFAAQIESIFPGHPDNHHVVESFELVKQRAIFTYPIFPQVVPVLTYLSHKNIRTFICSSTKQAIITSYIQRNQLDELLDGFFGHKPGFEKSEQIGFILQHYILRPKEVIFVGDSLRDYDLAHERDVQFVGITGLFKHQDFQDIGAPSINCLDNLVQLVRTA